MQKLVGNLDYECTIKPIFVLRSSKFETLKRKGIVLRKWFTTASALDDVLPKAVQFMRASLNHACGGNLLI